MNSLPYLTQSRLDLLFNVGFLCRLMENLTTEHLKSAKRILSYAKGTLELVLKYKQSDKFVLERYFDSDYGGDNEERKSTSGCSCSLVKT